MSTINRVELINISKAFGGIKALKDVSLQVLPGEVHALLGENGAGKSTLMKVLSGAHQKDSGKIFIDGQEVHIKSTADSKRLGIGIIYQEFSLVPNLSVSENIFLNRFNQDFWVHWKEMAQKSSKLIQRLGFNINPLEKVSSLSIAEQQIVEIAKALSEEVKVLILDEPSAVLGSKDIEKLFDIIRGLKEQGVSIIYISHHLSEIFTIADRVTVIKDGSTVESHYIHETNKDSLIALMLGRPFGNMFEERNVKLGNEVFSAQNIHYKNRVKDVSFSIRSGEVLGMAGLVGSGRTETAEAIFAAIKKDQGILKLNGDVVKSNSPSNSIDLGIGMVNEDRKQKGVLLSLPVSQNITLTNLRSISNTFGFISKKRENKIADDLIAKLQIKVSNRKMYVGNLSGGNQQKVAIAKWINRGSRFLIVDEPTRGVDVGAKVEIYRLINELAERGIAILVISSETAELMGLCDRIMVLKDGSVQGTLLKNEFSEEQILRLAIGVNQKAI
jgi:ribose transport system ATP-binding protein